jgi:fatty-acyl-CoA synthase
VANPDLAKVLTRLRLMAGPLGAAAWSRAEKVVPRPLLDILTLAQRGVVRPMRPDKLVRIARAWQLWGVTPHLGFAVGAVRHPDRTAVIDERGALSYAEIDRRTTRLAHGLSRQGVKNGTRVAVLCRNHHGLVETILASGKLGADLVLLNTSLSPRLISELLTEHEVSVLVADSEFSEQLTDRLESVHLVLAWTEGTTRHATLEHLIGTSSSKRLPKPPRNAKMIVLTSGTTGTPKGARRPDPPGLSAPATMLSRIPLHTGERTLITAPLFHTWGLAAFQLGSVLGSTVILQRKFDPQQALSAAHRHQCTSMFAVPVMLQRILELPESTRSRYSLNSLDVVACSGSALPGDLARRFRQQFGPVLYNVYGSTEVSWVTIADPKDLQQAPGTSGRAPRGTVVRILDEEGSPVRTGVTGRVFAGNDMLFDGYTHGTTKEVVEGLMSTGDLGHLDAQGRLFLAGREDDMIVSGGENVYPRETEDTLLALPEVAEAAVTGVEDEEFGQRLAAFVVLREGSSLDADTVRERLRGEVSKFALPRDVVFLDALPRNALGKVVTRELPTSY